MLQKLQRLLAYYEDDITILALAGEKAKLMQRFGIDPSKPNPVTQDEMDAGSVELF